MALFGEFRYGDGVLYGALSPALKFSVTQHVAGGGVHGGAQIDWDLTAFTPNAVCIVAREQTPAMSPEEGRAVVLQWQGQVATSSTGYDFAVEPATGSVVTDNRPGRWTYYSLFYMGADMRWTMVAFRLFLPVADWQYGSVLATLLPGAMLSDGPSEAVNSVNLPGQQGPYYIDPDTNLPVEWMTGYTSQNTAGAPANSSLLGQFLAEMGFIFDTVKTAAEALVPFWDIENMVPQAGPALARIMRLPYYSGIGPGAYFRLMKTADYSENTLDVLGLKAEAISQWSCRARLSNNYMLTINDSSGEADGVQPVWVSGNNLRPTRLAHSVPPEHLEPYGVLARGYYRFAADVYLCGDPSDSLAKHGIPMLGWPSVVGGFWARMPPGATEPIDVTLSATTDNADGMGGHVVILRALVDSSDWTWYGSDRVIPIGRDDHLYPRLYVSDTVDLDVIAVGPGPSWNPDRLVVQCTVDDTEVTLTLSGAPTYGTAIISWGDGTEPTELTWDEATALGATHTYADVMRGRGAPIVIKDLRDPLVATTFLVEVPVAVGA